MDRKQMIERVVTVMLSEYIEEDLTPRAWDYMLAEKVLDAILPQITTVEELEALPVGIVVRSDVGTIACRADSTRGVVFGDERPFPWGMLRLPLTVVWRP